jgi:hypothetical protein
MKKTISYVFEGSLGYQYVAKRWNSPMIKYEFNLQEGDVTHNIIFDASNQDSRSIVRSTVRSLMEIDKASTVEMLNNMMDDYADEIAEVNSGN